MWKPSLVSSLVFLVGCASAGSPSTTPALSAQAIQAEAEVDDEADRSILHALLWYVPNRLLDLFDVVRGGICAGPGVGVSVVPTEYLQATAMARVSGGVGLQTLRHSPFQWGTEGELAIGPLGADDEPDKGGWHHSKTDLRIDLHVLLVGGYVAVEPVEILDFLAGLVFLDPREDDR